MSLDRAGMLARIRDALGSERGPLDDGAAIDEDILRRVQRGDDLVERFRAAATDAGMTVHLTQASALHLTVRSILSRGDIKSVAFGMAAIDPELIDALHDGGIDRVESGASLGYDTQFDVDAGITDVIAAVAETGSLVLASDARHSRATYVVPPRHIAIVQADQIVPDLIDLFRSPPRRMPASYVLVSGPSKTGDIEGVLVTGVHGPGQVDVVVVAKGGEGT